MSKNSPYIHIQGKLVPGIKTKEEGNMKKLRKVKTNLQDSVEAYAGSCTCEPNCHCYSCNCSCNPAIELYRNVIYNADGVPQYENLEFVGVSTSLSSVHWS